MTNNYETIVFDLDGTLLDTLTDLMNSTNWLMKEYGWPVHTYNQICSYVGNGLYKLIERAVPKDTPKAILDEGFGRFKEYYVAHCMDETRPYNGIVEMLKQVKQAGIRTALVTNKAQAATDLLYDRYFKGLIEVAIGQQNGMAIKPAPDEVDLALAKLGVSKQSAIYIGDSEVDKQTADNAQLPCALCAWGFRGRPFIDELKPKYIIDQPQDLLAKINNKTNNR